MRHWITSFLKVDDGSNVPGISVIRKPKLLATLRSALTVP